MNTIVLDSRFDCLNYNNSNGHIEFKLPMSVSNAHTCKLKYLSFANSLPNIYSTEPFTIQGSSIAISDGNYSASQIVSLINSSLNSNMFQCYISPFTFQLVIVSNSQFSMNFPVNSCQRQLGFAKNNHIDHPVISSVNAAGVDLTRILGGSYSQPSFFINQYIISPYPVSLEPIHNLYVHIEEFPNNFYFSSINGPKCCCFVLPLTVGPSEVKYFQESDATIMVNIHPSTLTKLTVRFINPHTGGTWRFNSHYTIILEFC